MIPRRNPLLTERIIQAAQAAEHATRLAASITLAQCWLESDLCTKMPPGSNNPFGIKALDGEAFVPAMTHEVINGIPMAVEAHFRKFDTLDDAFVHHARLLALGRPYAKFRKALSNPLTYIPLMAPVYASDKSYASKLLTLIRQNRLDVYDAKPDAPAVAVSGTALAAVGAATAAKLPPALPPVTVGIHLLVWHALEPQIIALLLAIWLAINTALLLRVLFPGKPPAKANPPPCGEEYEMIRPEAQPIIDAVTKLAAEAATATTAAATQAAADKAALDQANADIASLQSQLAAQTAAVAQKTQDDAETDAALKAAAGMPAS